MLAEVKRVLKKMREKEKEKEKNLFWSSFLKELIGLRRVGINGPHHQDITGTVVRTKYFPFTFIYVRMHI